MTTVSCYGILTDEDVRRLIPMTSSGNLEFHLERSLADLSPMTEGSVFLFNMFDITNSLNSAGRGWVNTCTLIIQHKTRRKVSMKFHLKSPHLFAVMGSEIIRFCNYSD
jgi:hypothetical protein